MKIVPFHRDLQTSVNSFFEECFTAVGIPYSPMNRHRDVADVERFYMKNGCFWCLMEREQIVGTIAIRTMKEDSKTAELKRMFVLPAYQGNGYGKMLLEFAISEARRQQYRKICLDTRTQFAAAQHLYRSAGFREIARYNENEYAELYFELVL